MFPSLIVNFGQGYMKDDMKIAEDIIMNVVLKQKSSNIMYIDI
jgi:hypothetical protein